MTGYLELIVGPMGSDKTSTLFKRLGEEYVMGQRRCLYVNHTDDDSRLCMQKIGNYASSHSPNPVSLNENITTQTVCLLGTIDVTQYDVIAVDEAHFFDDLRTSIKGWLTLGKVVYCAGLNASSNMEDIGQISLMFSMADKIVHKKAICTQCEKAMKYIGKVPKTATFTYRKCTNKRTLYAGGMDEYMPVCRYHYTQLMNSS